MTIEGILGRKRGMSQVCEWMRPQLPSGFRPEVQP
jgi:hypothetical protein